jgi:hypothetical protein
MSSFPGSRIVPALAVTLLLLLSFARNAEAVRQKAVMIPVSIAGDNTSGFSEGVLDRAIVDKMSDRFDIRLLKHEPDADPESLARKGATLGAPYLIDGSLSRIGRSVSLELRIRSIEPGSIGKTVVATGQDAPSDKPPQSDLIPPVYRRLMTEATANLKMRFFGDDRSVGGGRIPVPAGKMTRSATFPGNPVSGFSGDVDGDGKRELVVAFDARIEIFRIDGDEIAPKAVIEEPGPGIIRVDLLDAPRGATPRLIVSRWAGGKAIGDLWEPAGKGFRKTAAAIPWFIGKVRYAGAGDILVGQESGADLPFKGPVFRVDTKTGSAPAKGAALQLPPGASIFNVVTLRYGKENRFLVVGSDGYPALYASDGSALGRGGEPVAGSGAGIGGEGGLRLPPRLFPVDLDGDGRDEIVCAHDLVTSGVFFENVRVRSGAELMAFTQDGSQLRLAWRTSQAVFAVVDAFPSDDPATPGRGFGLLIREKGKLLEGQSEWRVVWYR